MAVLLGGIGATKKVSPVYVYDLYKEVQGKGLVFVKQVKIRRMTSSTARDAMFNYVNKLRKKTGLRYQFELDRVIGEKNPVGVDRFFQNN